MPKTVKIFVEGVADIKFLSDYISHLFPDLNIEKDSIVNCEGWTNNRETSSNLMAQNTDNGGVNLLIFDADKKFNERKKELEEWKNSANLSFETFLLPNNSDPGALEDLLENIIAEENQPVFDCWNNYEECLKTKSDERKSFTTPAKKTKIYSYLEALLGETREEKKKIKERERNYKNLKHWNLNSEALNPLKDFLMEHIS